MNSERSYRRLFFIKFLHGFFLDTDADRYFTLTDGKIDERLQATIVNGQYTLMDDLVIRPSEETEAVLKGHRLVYKVLPHGLLVGCAIQDEMIDGVIRSKPIIPLKQNLRLQFYISAKNAFRIYSSTRLDTVIPAAYYFTNDNKAAGLSYPSLSVPVQQFIDGRFYQMGETAVVNGTLQQAILPTKSAQTGWTGFDLKGINYVNEYDRILIGKTFTYTFDSKGITEATFELRQNGEPVKKITVSEEKGLSEVSLAFEKKDDGQTPVEDGIYQLIVTASGNYAWNSDLYLSNRFYSPGRLAVMDILMHTEDQKFSILDENGYLTGADPSSYPRMELRFLNRSTYWKYYFQQKGPTEADNAWDTLPAPLGMDKVILSKEPIPLMKAIQKKTYAANLLPNPSEQKLGKEADKIKGVKICSEILLTKIKL